MNQQRHLLRGLIVLLLLVRTCQAFGLKMSAGGGVANLFLSKSDSATLFVTNKKCPYAHKVWLALEVVQAPYRMKEVDLYGPGGKPDWFLELNPRGTVPVLECYGGSVTYLESDLILDKILEGDVPNGPLIAAESEAIEEMITKWRTMLNDQLIPIGKKTVQRGGGNTDELQKVLKEMDGMVEGKYLTGRKVSLADCAIFPFVWRLNEEYGLEALDCPNLKDWLDRCDTNEAFVTTKPTEGWWWWW